MMRLITWVASAVLVTALAALALPRLYAIAFAPQIAPTYLFYSPVSQEFIYREHHGNHDFRYASESGAIYDRQGFETLLPFIYYKNMDIWGLLPIQIDGQRFDRETIRDARQVFELKPREITGQRHEIPVYALIDSDPGRAGLSFPEDVFVPRETGLQVLNVDANRVDAGLTDRFNTALIAAGFAFPARLVAGKQTILKPWDAGVFLVDATGAVFHMTRTGDSPHVTRTPIPADLGIRHIKVTENQKRDILGMILTDDARLFVLTMPGYGLIELPTTGYAPQTMAYKLLLNPVAPTAIYGDGQRVQGVAMAPDFTPVAEYTRVVPATDAMAQARIAKVLFPVTLSLEARTGPYLRWHLTWAGWWGLIGIAGSLAALGLVARTRQQPWRQTLPAAALVALTGLPGLIAVLAVPPPTPHR